MCGPAKQSAIFMVLRATAFGTAAIGWRSSRSRRKSPMKKLSFALAVFLSGLPSYVLAQGHTGTPPEQQACSRDAKRFCRHQLGDDNAVQQCLMQNRSRLSKSCSAVFQSHGM